MLHRPFRTTTSLLTLTVVLAVFAAGCDLFGFSSDTDVTTSGVAVANSGNFADQDGSITIYDPERTLASTADIQAAFIHSVAQRDGRLYVVDNTASDGRGRITIFDAETLERVGQIQSPDRPPRYIAFASDTKAYVTNLTLDGFTPQPSTVSIVDLEQEVVTDSIDVGVSPEGIAVTAGKAFVANAGGTTLSVIDTEQDAVTTTLDLECSSPNEVFVDQENEVVVVCEGSGEDDAEVLFVDPADVAVTQRVALNGDVGSLNATQSADYAPRAEELYAIDGGGFTASGFQEGGTVYRIDTDANALATTLKVPESNRLVGATAVGYDAIAQRLYVARLPVGEGGGPLFDADGRTVILDRSGAQVGSFEVGNSPAHLFFQRTP